jgi:LysM repeat protein
MSAITVGDFTSYSSRPVRTKLRMTKRGRAVLLTLVSTPLVIAALAFGLNAGAATGTSSSTPLTKITVVGGETLWGVASQIAPKADPRDVIAAIENVNQLTSATIQPGQQLSIPAQYAQH